MWIKGSTLPGAGGVLALFLLAALSTPAAYSSSSTELQSARVSLSAARDALSAASAEFRTLLSKGGMSQSDTNDFLAYIGRLKRSVVSNCRVVLELKAQLGDMASEPGCNAEEMKPAGPVSFPEERTEEETIAGLDAQLGSSMSEFDELLLREMDELQRKRSGSPDGSGRSGTGAGDAGGDGDGSAERGDEANSGAEAAQEGRQTGEQQQGETASTSDTGERQGGAEGDSPPGEQDTSRTTSRDAPPPDSDDDIVARQLREAAEKETDPVLREKLWEEYRRYKEKQTARSKNLN